MRNSITKKREKKTGMGNHFTQTKQAQEMAINEREDARTQVKSINRTLDKRKRKCNPLSPDIYKRIHKYIRPI